MHANIIRAIRTTTRNACNDYSRACEAENMNRFDDKERHTPEIIAAGARYRTWSPMLRMCFEHGRRT